MADGDDSEAVGGGKARAFSAEQLARLRGTLAPQKGQLSAARFDEEMQAWLAQHAGAREQRYNWRKPADVLAGQEPAALPTAGHTVRPLPKDGTVRDLLP
jgi:hypothetical protein